MTKHEAKWTSDTLQPWIREVYKKLPGSQSAPFEAKHTIGSDSLAFSELSEVEEHFLLAAKHGVATHKISDSGIGYKNTDVVCFVKSAAWVAIAYPNDLGVVIDIDEFIAERERSKRKSLTSERAKIIAEYVI